MNAGSLVGSEDSAGDKADMHTSLMELKGET
jgi:hypothetical protein